MDDSQMQLFSEPPRCEMTLSDSGPCQGEAMRRCAACERKLCTNCSNACCNEIFCGFCLLRHWVGARCEGSRRDRAA
jgi:hypothetical protein